jgi:hypothetical protein
MSAFRDQLRDQLEEAIERVKRQLQQGGLSIAGIDVGAEIAHGIESTQKRIVSLGLQAAEKISSSGFPLSDVVRPWVEQCAHVLGALDPTHTRHVPSYGVPGQGEPHVGSLREIDRVSPDNDVADTSEPAVQKVTPPAASVPTVSDRQASEREEFPGAAVRNTVSREHAGSSRPSRGKPAASAPRVRVQAQPRPSARSGRKPRAPSDPRSN